MRRGWLELRVDSYQHRRCSISGTIVATTAFSGPASPQLQLDVGLMHIRSTLLADKAHAEHYNIDLRMYDVVHASR